MNKKKPVAPTPDVLQEEILRRIASAGGIHQYPANTVLIHEGERSDTLFILLSGRVKVYAANEQGKEVTIIYHGPGEYVGEMALDGGVRSASVMTTEPTACSVVSGADLRQFIAAHPDFAQHLVKKLIRRVRQATESLKALALLDVYGRIVKLLNDLSVPDGEQRVIDERLTQQDIADRVGASREMVSRILGGLRIGGFIKVTGGRIRIFKKLPAAF
ncbi:MAG: Crp/Fnr family transcriptional regulator [Proteobacteria bacterium]|nr:Crp/Fnr family transcriptional regulator [Pseudomonadota bacterium]